MIDANHIKATARGQWQHILTRIGIPASSLKNKHQPCPMCGGKDRFRFDDKQGSGSYYCNQCGSGDGIGFVMAWQQCNYSQALATVAQIIGLSDGKAATTHRQPETPKTIEPPDYIGKLTELWQQAQTIHENDPVHAYLRQRGLSLPTLPNNIRYHAALPYWTASICDQPLHIGNYPAMISRIDNTQGEMQGLHFTYLDPNQKSKRRIIHPETGETLKAKKMRVRQPERLKGASVQLLPAQAERPLIVAEGIETALAASELFECPAWAALSANGLKAFEPPPDIHKILIVADHDTPRPIGYEAAHDLAVRLIKQGGFYVQIWQPERQGFDALDELNYRHSKAYQIAQHLYPQRPIKT